MTYTLTARSVQRSIRNEIQWNKPDRAEGEKTMQTKTETHTTQELIDNPKLSPLPMGAIPDYMGINLCSVEGLTWTRQEDGQLISLTINFMPATDAGKKLD